MMVWVLPVLILFPVFTEAIMHSCRHSLCLDLTTQRLKSSCCLSGRFFSQHLHLCRQFTHVAAFGLFVNPLPCEPLVHSVPCGVFYFLVPSWIFVYLVLVPYIFVPGSGTTYIFVFLVAVLCICVPGSGRCRRTLHPWSSVHVGRHEPELLHSGSGRRLQPAASSHLDDRQARGGASLFRSKNLSVSYIKGNFDDLFI